ncbi:restriction endonuclease subunit S [Serratia sp. IR-2025]|uniref:restriction endonuclease subunit S n=1 Tax=Serratia ureilytica TaxID=300181 RepID=UPI00254B6048|nr:restriction endonuclease subunit S [Serratia ureilytica]
MSFEMIQVNLGDFIDFRNGKSSPDRTPDGEFNVFGSNGIIGQCAEKNASEFSLIIGRVGSYCGSVYQSRKACWVTDNAIIGALKNKDELNFWYFLLTKLDINAMSSGSGQPLINQKLLNNIQVRVPLSSAIRVDIGNYLNLFNKKIKINYEINQTLEQMAQTLFKSWFVDFEPVKAKIAVLEAGGSQEDATLAAMTAISGKDADALAVFEREHPEQYAELKSTAELFPSAMQDSELISIPDGWERGHVVDVTEKIFSGGTPTTTKPEYWGGDNNWFSSGETRNAFIINTEKRITSLGIKQSSTKKSILGDVLIASAGQGHTRGQTSLNMIDTYINQSVVAVRPKNKKMIAWLFLNLRSRYDEMRAISDSHSSRGSLTTKLISGMPIIIPDDRILKKFENSTFPLFNFIGHKLSEIESLAKLRDTLLPKLLSGEITLPEVEQAIGEVENV